MNRRELKDCMQRLAERYQLRYLEKYKRFVGLYRGIGLSVWEFDNAITLGFFCPTVDIGDQILEDFVGFHHCEEAGLSNAWITALRELDTDNKSGQTTSHRGCVLQINKDRLEGIGVEKFMDIPEIVALDLYEYGATESWACDMCGQQTATDTFFGGAYASLCNRCWYEAQLKLKRRKKKPIVSTCIAFAVIAAIIILAAIIFWPRPGAMSYIRGVKAHERKDYDLAITYFTEAIRLDPKFVQAYGMRAFTYGRQRQWNKAITDFTKVLELDPKNAMAYGGRGWVYWSKGKYDEAIADYNEAVQLDLKYPAAYAETYAGRAAAYNEKREYHKSIADCTKALELDPKNAAAYNNRGIAYYMKGEYDKAWEDVHKAQSLGTQVHSGFLNDLREASGRER